MQTTRPEAILTRIETLSPHDGPGLRTTLFFKGCSLRCRWCHNPETIRPFPELQWQRRLCIGCQRCATACTTKAINFTRLSSDPAAPLSACLSARCSTDPSGSLSARLSAERSMLPPVDLAAVPLSARCSAEHSGSLSAHLSGDHSMLPPVEFAIAPLSAERSMRQDFLIDRERCTRCFSCVSRCPSGALSRVGKTYTLQESAKEILLEADLIRQLNGGVTFSGGEPALQSDFIRQLAEMLKVRDLHLALDTCGQAPFAAYEQLVPLMDLILFDVKEIDPEKHRDFTGADNQRILRNLHAICRLIRTKGYPTRLRIRTPLIPGMTATSKNITATGTFLATHFADLVDRWELCSFNKMCQEKYARFGVDWPLSATPLLREEEMKELLEEAKRAAPGMNIKASGLTKKSNAYDN